jgi:molybdenum cofactor synthesis domain-containing protein
MHCTVELLSIGNELLLGNTVNTNASWLASQITSAGGTVTRITTIGDKLDEISSAIKETLRREPDFLITTGGIGPTFDDMSLQGVGRALSRRLKLDSHALEMIRAHYARRFNQNLIQLTKPRLKMARIPSGAAPIPNPIGTAPGVLLKAGRTRIFCLPGVPSEAKAIFRASILKTIRAATGGKTFTEEWLWVSGIMESTLAPIIDQTMRHWPGVYIKSHPRGVEASGRPHIELHFSTFSTTPKTASRAVGGAVSEMKRGLKSRGAKFGLSA